MSTQLHLTQWHLVAGLLAEVQLDRQSLSGGCSSRRLHSQPGGTLKHVFNHDAGHCRQRALMRPWLHLQKGQVKLLCGPTFY